MIDDLTRDLRDLSKRFVFQGGSEYANGIAGEIERLRAECLRLNHAEAEAMSVVLSQEGQIERLKHQANNDICEIERMHDEIERLRGMYLKWRGLAVLAMHKWEAGEDLQGVVDTIDQERINERKL
jgi:hypothetical protein